MKIKPIKDYWIVRPWAFVLSHWSVLVETLSFLKVVAVDFFGLQYNRKLGFNRIKIVRVDNSLDDLIPFTPSKVHIYLDFIQFWVRPLSMMIKKLGPKKAKPYMISFIRLIKKAYYEASRMYKFKLTTTKRPFAAQYIRFIEIYFMDPHLLCVPSLHISIIALCYAFYRRMFSELPEYFSAEEKEFYENEIYSYGVEIAESVLYVKQHSVNCIPAALYMITHIMSDDFKAVDGTRFMDDILVHDKRISAENKKKIVDYMQFIYERFLIEGVTENDWREPVKRWLCEYIYSTGQD